MPLRPLSAGELLAAWEAGQGQPPLAQALALLAAASTSTPAEWAALPLGQRDAALLTLREWTFGPDLTALASCPDCGTTLELGSAVADLHVAPAPPAEESSALTVDGIMVRFRPPNSADLVAIAGETDPATARRRLLERCVLAVYPEEGTRRGRPDRRPIARRGGGGHRGRDGGSRPAGRYANGPDLPGVWARLVRPLRHRRLLLARNRSLGHAHAARIHALALAYGWREADILALSPRRRAIYLELVRG